ncbi:hypothetical protein PR003_g10792 [Phytophthora rubi]|uniref:Uncharacterized protein n=1 Tax=Phytophthora rubi TaxID=129364 RepID=A0A6A4FIR5_9STRA|nr:hypothetical protein PR003_g10792 [Phytophthora rubi]
MCYTPNTIRTGFTHDLDFDLFRWTVPSVDLREVHQFKYTDFESNPGKRARQRTPQEGYKEVVRDTGLISSELSEISDDDEIDRMLDYVLKQRHNVRNKNYDGDSSPSNSHTKPQSPQK